MGHIADEALLGPPIVIRSAPEPASSPRASKDAAQSAYESIDDAPISSRRKGAGAADRKLNDDHADLSDSSISGKFFRPDPDDASLMPVVDTPHDHDHDHDEETGPRSALSPAALARRARLRRFVGGVIAFIGVLAVAVVGKTVVSGRGPAPSAPAAPPMAGAPPTRADAKATAKPAEPKPALTEMPQAKPAETAAPEAKPAETAAPEAKAEDTKPAPVDEAKPTESTPDPQRSAALQKETETLLNRGKYKDAIAKAREAIEADPSHALPYLYLGSALQDTGKWKDGIEAYSECVRKATKGPVHECRQMGGRK